jgi:hypothetical protein
MFAELVMKHFKYLIDSYGFTVAKEEPIHGGTVVEFRSRYCRVRVVLDRCQVVVEIGPNKLFNKPWFDLSYVILFKDPDSHFEYEFDPEGYVQDRESSQDRQVRRVAELTRRYCEEMLRGDFSSQEDLKRFIRQYQARDPLNAGQ